MPNPFKTGLVALSLMFGCTSASLAREVEKPNDWQARCAKATAYSTARRGLAILVLSNGRPVCEHYAEGDQETANELWSGTKSFVGIMAAAAVQDGLLSLDEPVSATIAEWRGDNTRQSTTIRHLLSMTSGQASTIGRPPTYADALLRPTNAPPGAKFQYGPTPVQIFGEVMRRKLQAKGYNGDPVLYLKQRVLDPIGMDVGEWRRDNDGNPLLAQGAILTPREWAKFGEFVRGGGILNGSPIVDQSTLATLFVSTPANPAYGLTWWLPHMPTVPDPVSATTDIGRRSSEIPADLVVAAGAGDQRLYIIPSLGLTIVRQARLNLLGTLLGRSSGWSDVDFLRILMHTPPQQVGKQG